MAKSLLYRYFGFGKLPESERLIATCEELLLDEGIRGSIRFDHFRAPGKRYHKKVSWFPGSLMITGNRFAAFAFSRPVIDIPLEGEYLRKLQYQLDDKQRLVVRFKAEDFQPDSSGEIECRFNTPYAMDFLARLGQAADYERGQLRGTPSPENLLFYEEQRPHWLWTWGISLLLLGYLAWVAEGFYQQLFLGIPWGNKPASDELFIYLMAGIAIFTIGMSAMLLSMNLEVQVRRNGLFVQLFPFHLRKLRPQIIPGRAVSANHTADDDGALHHAGSARMSWARLLKRVFDIDMEHCPHCGGKLKIIAALEEPRVIAKILAHLGLPTRAPPRSPARSFDLLETA